jgi:hypothetical protein
MPVYNANDSFHVSLQTRKLFQTWLEDYETKLNYTLAAVDESQWNYASVGVGWM